MVEKKFRIFDWKAGVFITDCNDFYISNSGEIFYRNPLMSFHNAILPLDIDYQFLSWSTGLRDKNFKEIYESDILNVKVHKNYCDVAQVIWLPSRLSFSLVFNADPSYPEDLYLINNDNWHVEIIGNIYENSDLIYKV